MEKIDFLPVLLASDINVYSMGRAFHKAYGIRSLMVARQLSGAVLHTKILDYIEEPHLDQDDVFLATMERIYKEYGGERKLLLIGCADHYVRLIVNHREALEGKFIMPYASREVMDNIVLKETFYRRCEEFGLDYAKTFVHTPDTGYDYTLPMSFPVVLKASDSVKYHAHKFEGFHKVFFIHDRKTLDATLKKIYAAGYDDHMLIQDMIPGEDACIYDLQVYTGSDHKVKLMNMGNVVLEEHTPTAIGNNAATIVEPHLDVMKKIQSFLEGIGYEGMCDCDLKYDRRDGTYKMLEINIRQGRSHYRVTGGGDNIAELITEDYVYHRLKNGTKYVTEPFFWHAVPLGVVYKYVKDKDKVKQIRQLVKEGRSCHSLYYDKDMSPKRWVYLKLRDINMYRKYKKYLKD
ncbi:MAG: carboxylate--amine ligase [Eubacteriales bacterium]|nr:carboxylate--amine ligase [Eubacteriales bacterium]